MSIPVYYAAGDASGPMPMVNAHDMATAVPMPPDMVAKYCATGVPAGFMPMLVGGAAAVATPVPELVEPAGAPAALAAAAPTYELTDRSVTLSPYFRLKDPAEFKRIWQEDYKKFANKSDCVHYAFCFTEDNTRAHCREAYTSAEKVLQHLADVDAPLKAVLDGPAELERLEVHGPAEEVDKLREALAPLGCLFYVTEWGSRSAKAAMAEDSVVHLYPYFQLKQPEEFKKIWYDAYPATKAAMDAEKSHQYAFSFEPTCGVASCRESYGDADGILLHLQNVDVPLKAVLAGPADLLRLEVHGPAAEVEKLKPALSPLGAEFFVTEWGFRNEVAAQKKAKKSKKAKVVKKKKGCC